jgi:hypothetical protein
LEIMLPSVPPQLEPGNNVAYRWAATSANPAGTMAVFDSLPLALDRLIDGFRPGSARRPEDGWSLAELSLLFELVPEAAVLAATASGKEGGPDPAAIASSVITLLDVAHALAHKRRELSER